MDLRGQPIWLNPTIMSHVFERLNKQEIFTSLTDEQLNMLEQLLPKEYLSRKMATITTGLSQTGQDMAVLTMLLLSFGSTRGDLLDVLGVTGPSSAHPMGGFHRGMKVTDYPDKVIMRYKEHPGISVWPIKIKKCFTPEEMDMTLAVHRSLLTTNELKIRSGSIGKDSPILAGLDQVSTEVSLVNEAVKR